MRTAALLLSVVLAGCGTLDAKTAQIEPGSSRRQVLAIMGTPDDRSVSGTEEALQFCVTGAGLGYNDHKVIWLSSGVVTGVTSYRSYGPPSCLAHMRAVNWQERPDTTIEVRHR